MNKLITRCEKCGSKQYCLGKLSYIQLSLNSLILHCSPKTKSSFPPKNLSQTENVDLERREGAGAMSNNMIDLVEW